MGTAKMATSSGSAVKAWDPHKTYDLSGNELRAVEERAEMRAALKAEYQKRVSYPFRGNANGPLFDPAVQRFMSMRAKHFDYFKQAPKNFAFFTTLVVAPILVFSILAQTTRAKQNKLCRSGAVAYKDRVCKTV